MVWKSFPVINADVPNNTAPKMHSRRTEAA